MTIVDPKASTPPSRQAVAFFAHAPGLAQGEREEALKQQDLAFRRFCDRHGFEPVATFVEPAAPNPEGPAEQGETAWRLLRRYVSQGSGVAVAMLRLDGLAPDEDRRILRVLELESLGAQLYLFSGQSIDSASVLLGTWPRQGKAPPNPGERIKAAMRTRAIRGEGLGKPPYGYRIGPKRRLEIVQAEAENVRLIYTLYTQKDLGIRLIVRYLNEHGILTRRGRNWSMVTIRDILKNRAYLGTYTRFGLRVPGSHAPIVTPEAFRWTQARLQERQPTRKQPAAQPFLLSSLIYCGSCGNRMMGVTRRQSWTRQRDGTRVHKEYRYYQCQSRTNQGICNYHTQNAKELEAKVLAFLVEQAPRLAAKGRRSGPSAASIQRERRRLQSGEARLEQRLKQAIGQVRAGRLSLARFRQAGAELLQARRETIDRLDALAASEASGAATLSPSQTAAASIEELASSWEGMPLDRKRDVVSALIDRIHVRESEVEITLRPELLP